MELKVYFMSLTLQDIFCNGLLEKSYLKKQIL